VTAALFFDRQPKPLQGEALVVCNSLVALVMVVVAVRGIGPTPTPTLSPCPNPNPDPDPVH
jgi:hypothetical protein